MKKINAPSLVSDMVRSQTVRKIAMAVEGTVEVIYRVPNKCGLQGWTIIDLKKVNMEILTEASKKAWLTVKGS